MKKVIRLSENDIEGLVKKIIREEKSGDLKKACWKGYEAVGMKVKNGKKVPNCVPIKEGHTGSIIDFEGVTDSLVNKLVSNQFSEKSRDDVYSLAKKTLEGRTASEDTIKEEIYHIFEAKKTKEDDVCFLTFQKGNEKLEWPLFSLPAAYTCPFATRCKNFPAKWDPEADNGRGGKGAFRRFASTGKTISQTKKTEFQCYAARAQSQYPAPNMNAFRNLDLLNLANKSGGVKAMTDLIVDSMNYYEKEKKFRFDILRVHEAGDFFTSDYMKAWFEAARRKPKTLFYAYTTSVPFWVENMKEKPVNFKLIASMDNENVDLINQHGLRFSRVVGSEEEAKELGLPIDVDDRIAWDEDRNFALMIHGPQHKDTPMAKALQVNKKAGVYDKMKSDKEQQQAYKDHRRELLRRKMNQPEYIQGELEFPELEESYYGINDRQSLIKENQEFGSEDVMLQGHKGYKGKVFVHRNLNKPPYWTVKARHGEDAGLVIGYDKTVCLTNVTFVVGEKSRQRVLASGQKNVHAGVVGNINSNCTPNTNGWIPVTYNPYKNRTFVRVDNGEPIFRAKEAVLKNEKEVWVKL